MPQVAAGIYRPTSSRARIGGTGLGRLSARRLTVLRRQRVGFVFQSFNLMGSLTAEQNVALPRRLEGRRPKAKTARPALMRVGLVGAASSCVPEPLAAASKAQGLPSSQAARSCDATIACISLLPHSSSRRKCFQSAVRLKMPLRPRPPITLRIISVVMPKPDMHATNLRS